jgi:lipoprotein-releasing system ATP-binding protein
MSDASPIVRVRALKKSYPRQRVDAPLWARLFGRAWGWTGALDAWPTLNEGVPVLNGVDVDVKQNEILAIVGPSGAGKSTLLHLIGALDAPNEGTILYKGEDVTMMSPGRVAHWRNVTIGFVFQFYHLFPDLDAEENVLIPAMVAYSPGAYLARRAELRERARHLLDRVGLGDRRHHHPNQLSGGEQQRVAIARALLLKPQLLLCDEPTGNLDRRTGEQILDLLWELKDKDGQTYIIVTHDERLSDRADRTIHMQDGNVVQENGRAAKAVVKKDVGPLPSTMPATPPGGSDFGRKPSGDDLPAARPKTVGGGAQPPPDDKTPTARVEGEVRASALAPIVAAPDLPPTTLPPTPPGATDFGRAPVDGPLPAPAKKTLFAAEEPPADDRTPTAKVGGEAHKVLYAVREAEKYLVPAFLDAPDHVLLLTQEERDEAVDAARGGRTPSRDLRAIVAERRRSKGPDEPRATT